MPTAVEPSPDAPALTLATERPLANPVIDDSNIKRMAARFQSEYPAPKPNPADQPDPSQMAPPPKPAAPPASATPAAAKPDAKPTTPSPTPPPPADPDDGIPGPDATVPLSRQNWQKLHASRNDVRARLTRKEQEAADALARAKQLEDELGKVRSSLPPDLDALRAAATEREKLAKEHAAALTALETANLERSPRFQNWWTTETEKHLKIAERHVPPDQRAAVRKLLMEPASTERDAALNAILEPLPGVAQRLVSGAMEQLEAVKIQREEALTAGSENWKKLQAAERAEREKADAAAAARRTALADRALAYARKLPSFQTDPQVPESAAEATRNEAWVRSVVAGDIDEETAVAIPAAAVEYLRLSQKEIPRLEAEIAKRDALIKQLQQASPAPSGGSAPAARAPEPKPGTSFASRVSALMKG